MEQTTSKQIFFELGDNVLKKKYYFLIFLLCIVLVITIITLAVNPLRKSEKAIREQVLAVVPITTSMDLVIESINNHTNWEIVWISNEHGYMLDDSGKPGERLGKSVGVMSMRVHLGTYRTLFLTDVTAYLAFDNDSKLIDVAIRKDQDSL